MEIKTAFHGKEVKNGILSFNKIREITMNTLQDRIRGSLIGGAIGDALGYPIEFMNMGKRAICYATICKTWKTARPYSRMTPR